MLMPEMHKDRDAGKIRFQYMEREIVTANVEVDYAVKNIKYQPLTKDIYALPFGVNKSPSIADAGEQMYNDAIQKAMEAL